MPFIEGLSLKDYIQKSGKVSIEITLDSAQQICKALIAAHKKGIVHRDLKPQNIMVDKKGHVYVMDFGIAKSMEASDLSRDGVVIGTPDYMSPDPAS